MPELPEVETMRRGVAAAMGARVVAARTLNCRQKPIGIVPAIEQFTARCVGQEVTAVERFGKRVALALGSGTRIIFEPRMTGLVLVADPPTEAHLRFELELSGAPFERILYWDRRGLGSVSCLTPAEFTQRLGPAQLGPDALILSREQLVARLGASRRAIKVALLDQRAVAGIGNLYASEILHRAAIDPQQRCDALSRRQWERLHEAIIVVLREAIYYEGSTLSDGTYRNALNQNGGYQNHHRVYDRAGQPCRGCGRTPVRRIVQAQRATFYCPRCQRARQTQRTP